MRTTTALRLIDAQPKKAWTVRLTAAGLDGADLATMDMLGEQPRHVAARQSLVREGDPAETVYVLLDGWAARVKSFADGRRQSTALLLPGDVCNLDALYVGCHDYTVLALTACRVAAVSRQQLGSLAASSPNVAVALGWFACVENAIATEWLACIGRRSARQHLAHLLCELQLRMDAVGLAEADGFLLPLTQEEMADAMGLTAVHVNRTVQSLRGEGLIKLDAHHLRILDWPGLQRVAGFHPGYLHLDGIRPLA